MFFHDKWYKRALKIENSLSDKGWKYIGSGKDRRVWKKNNVVLKIAYNDSGIVANRNERQIYVQHMCVHKYAPCRLICDSILMMRAIKEIDCLDDVDIPNWVNNLVDGDQIGIDRSGNILVYDYADQIGEL